MFNFRTLGQSEKILDNGNLSDFMYDMSVSCVHSPCVFLVFFVYVCVCVSLCVCSYFLATKLEHEIRALLEGKKFSETKVSRIAKEAKRGFGYQQQENPTLSVAPPISFSAGIHPVTCFHTCM